MKRIVDLKKPKTGKIIDEGRFIMMVRWHDDDCEILFLNDLKRVFLGKPRYVIYDDNSNEGKQREISI